jgi:mRNA-degrading endonuclease toxin of MazEF toxin-antitoxin module
MVTSRRVARGEIWWFEPPQAKARPVVILTRDEVIPHLNHLIAAPTTRRIRSIPSEVELDDTDGMPVTCAVSLDNVFPVRPAFLTTRLTILGPERMSQICQALANSIAC